MIGAFFISFIFVERDKIGEFGPFLLLANLGHDAHYDVLETVRAEEGRFTRASHHVFGHANDVIARLLPVNLEKFILQNEHFAAEGPILVLGFQLSQALVGEDEEADLLNAPVVEHKTILCVAALGVDC